MKQKSKNTTIDRLKTMSKNSRGNLNICHDPNLDSPFCYRNC